MNVHYRKEKTRTSSRRWLTMCATREPMQEALVNVSHKLHLELEDPNLRTVGADTVMGLTLSGGLILSGADTV